MKAGLSYRDRPLAFTDVETTGLDETQHEIIEIGLVLADQRTLDVIAKMNVLVKPEHIERAEARALEVNGYDEEKWRDAGPLKDAMDVYAQMTRNAMFIAHSVTHDWAFIKAAFRQTGVMNQMDYHRIDLWTVAYEALKDAADCHSLRLKDICSFLGVPEEPMPHRGINGALSALEVYRQLQILRRP